MPLHLSVAFREAFSGDVWEAKTAKFASFKETSSIFSAGGKKTNQIGLLYYLFLYLHPCDSDPTMCDPADYKVNKENEMHLWKDETLCSFVDY